jgi:hypothetical protein
MTVAENIFLGDLPRRFGIVDWSAVHARARDLLDHWGIALDPRARVADLGVGQQQLLEIARALPAPTSARARRVDGTPRATSRRVVTARAQAPHERLVHLSRTSWTRCSRR